VQLQQVYNEAMARIRAGQSPFAAQEGVKRVTLNNADYTNRRGGPTFSGLLFQDPPRTTRRCEAVQASAVSAGSNRPPQKIA